MFTPTTSLSPTRRLRLACLVGVLMPAATWAQAVRIGVPSDHPHQPACTFEGGVVQPHTPRPGQDQHAGEERRDARVVWPAGPGTIWLAHDPPWGVGSQRPLQGDGTLTRVDCHTGQAAVVVNKPGADFGNAALSRNGRALYFTGLQGVDRLDTRTLKITGVTRHPGARCEPLEDLGFGTSPVTPTDPRDVVVGFVPFTKRLRILRGHGCPGIDCSTGGWRGEALDLDLAGHRARLTPADAQPTAITRTVDGLIFVADGHDCDPADDCGGRLWRSADGRTFTRAKAPVDIAALWADAHLPGSLLVQTPTLSNDRADPWGARLWRTRDGGATWTALKAPETKDDSLGGHSNDELPFAAVQVMDGHLDHLRVIYGEHFKAYETRDGGETWTPGPEPVPTQTPTTLAVDAVTFEVTPGGLLRTEAGRTQRLLLP